MIQIARYGIGPYYGTQHTINQMRQVYEYRGVTVYLDRESRPRWTEVFAYIDDGPLWFVADFAGRDWPNAEEMARVRVDSWIEFLEEKDK